MTGLLVGSVGYWTVMILGLRDVGSVLFIEHVHALADEERKAKLYSNNSMKITA